ncbi:SH3 and cysteine-rich domain-containing protein [Antrostomus carolinensis]|uniref:SH3 and cysteine-rich domain-containing protein n=1 Tax=Antrostomus carolinensis TaxID=279965 RepID=A0A094L2K6_ANTCR|nr:SH3 and cysteine-rich domain-containing protein isoform X1 [Antrostomus carolinensis]KFZ65075.1 SH3 and cysteine-rich domain-containing protein [Antrostomus carolinensis]
MIPPSSTTEVSVDSVEKENEVESTEQPPSPASTTSQESKLQKLKRSLSFKTKSLRSKSADNFFQRTNSDVKLQVDLMPEVSTSTGQLPSSESQASSPTRAQQLPENNKTHIFQEHIFKKPTFCDVCNHMIVGTNAKHGLRCKACKMSIHHKCADSIGQQRCMGKLPKGFRRYYSSPLLIHEQFGCIKEVMPIACGNKVDPVYETLRFGTSLAQKTKKGSSGSGSDSPNRNSTADLAEVPEEGDSSAGNLDISRKRSNSVFTYSENGTEHFGEEPKSIHSPGPFYKSTLQMNTYVALYKFVPQENEDLEMRPGDMITLLEDSNEDWWKGKIDDRTGFFPANFVQRVQQDEKIYRCIRTFIGCKEQGQITLKENQICVTSEKEHDGFIKVYSGKKKGFVPIDILENI